MVKELDIIDKSLLQLSRLFDNQVDFYDYEMIDHESIDGKILIGKNSIPFSLQSNPSISNINYISGLIRSPSKVLFVFDSASRKVIEYCIDNQINFVDSNGSCYINLPDLKIWIESGANVSSNPSKSRAFQKSGLILLFELFNQPDLLKSNYRDLAKYCGISISSMTHIFDDLKERDYLVESKSLPRKFTNCKQLILKWAYNYNENLRPGYHRGYFKSLDNNLLDSILLDEKEIDFKISGAKGLSLLNKYIKSDQLILYSNSKLSRFARDFKILPSNKEDKDVIEILEPFWNTKNYKGNIDNNKVADEILIFADLLNSKDYRIIESAENLLNNEIRNRFITNKFQW